MLGMKGRRYKLSWCGSHGERGAVCKGGGRVSDRDESCSL